MSDDTLLNMAREIGEIKGLVAGVDAKVTTQIAQTATVAARVTTLEHAAERQRGAVRVLLAIWTTVGSIVGAAVSWFLGKHA